MKNMKIKIKKRKLELTIIFLTLLLIVLIKLITITVVSAEDILSAIPSLFYNDTHFVYSVPGNNIYLPLEEIDGVYYIPLGMLNLLNDLEMQSNDHYTESFIILYNKTNWISFKISSERAQSGTRDYISCKVYTRHGVIYVPAQIIADNLGLNWEYKPEYKTGRIKEKYASKTFDELLERYIPKPQPTTPPPTESPTKPPPVIIEPVIEITTPDPVIIFEPATEPETTRYNNNNITITQTTEPTTTAEPTTVENTREIQNYLIFYDSYAYNYYTTEENHKESKESEESIIINKPGATTDNKTKITEVLKALDKSNIRAVFFFSGGEITKNPDILRKIYASGHELGIKAENSKLNNTAEDLISELEEANDLIYAAIKHKIRFCMLDESDSGDEFYELYGDKLAEYGYYLCKNTVDASDLSDIADSHEMIDFMKKKRVNVFMFDISGSYRNYLELSSRAAEEKFYIKFFYLNNANIETVKRLIN
ncbi:MAG: polysaccharide deacetylase family protein [Oscillospiraceae bacterium]|nr:polysaccharide deacetylase family protein [Oscillospiraceae bacterium]